VHAVVHDAPENSSTVLIWMMLF